MWKPTHYPQELRKPALPVPFDGCRIAMTQSIRQILDGDELYTIAVRLMERLRDLLDDAQLPGYAARVMDAIDDLGCGPWRHVSGLTEGIDLAYAPTRQAIDLALDRLSQISSDPDAEEAIFSARFFLRGLFPHL